MDTTPKAIAKRPSTHPLKRAPRRLRTLAEKRRIVEETFEPGASVSVVARRHDVNANLVFGWRKLYRAGMLTASETKAASLVRLRVRRARGEPTRPLTVEIVLAKGSIRLSGGIDARVLADVIEALA